MRGYPSSNDLEVGDVFWGWVQLVNQPDYQQVLLRFDDSNTFDLLEHKGQKVLIDSVKDWSYPAPPSLTIPSHLCHASL